MSDHKILERLAGSIQGKYWRYPNIILFFVKLFQSTDYAYIEILQDSTLANFIIFGLHAIFYALHLGIFICVRVLNLICPTPSVNLPPLSERKPKKKLYHFHKKINAIKVSSKTKYHILFRDSNSSSASIVSISQFLQSSYCCS